MRKALGYTLLFISCIAFTVLLAVPFLPLDTAEKAAWGGGIFIFAEVTWYLALALLGKEIIELGRKWWLKAKALLDEEQHSIETDDSANQEPSLPDSSSDKSSKKSSIQGS